MTLNLLFATIVITIFKKGLTTACHEESFTYDGLKYNIHNLKGHLPPYQKYSDRSNFFGADPLDQKKYVFFNIADYVHRQKIDSRHSVTSRCYPRTSKAQQLTNTPVACVPEEEENCDDGGLCWIAVGSCDNFLFKSTNDGIHLVYSNGDFPDKKFVVSIMCCTEGSCLTKSGLDSPIKFKRSGCYNDADYCVEFSSPYGCDCASRELIDADLNVRQFSCDVVPSGLSTGLSTGSWLLIFFFTICGLYLGVGIAYNCSDGHRGTEAIPHFEMWTDICSLIYEGFMFVKSCGEYRDGFQYGSI